MAEKYFSTAKVIDGILVLSLPDAVTPVVWQMELGQSKSSALEIRKSDDGLFVLTLKTTRQDVQDIASYENRDRAIKALLVVSSAMEKAQGQLKAANGNMVNSYPVPALSHSNPTGIHSFFHTLTRVLGFIAKLLGGLVICAGLFFIFTKFFLGSSDSKVSVNSKDSAPMSADDFLENR